MLCFEIPTPRNSPRSGCSLAFQQPGLESCEKATTDEEESHAIIVSLPYEIDLCLTHDVVGVMRAHHGAVQGRACREGMCWLDCSSGAQLCWLAGFGDLQDGRVRRSAVA